MSEGLTRRSFAVFRRALEVESHERPAFVVDACGDDTGLRRRVEALVAAIDRTGGFLETPAARTGPRRPAPRTLGPGDVIAGYEITSVIGVGGMGAVYEAMQQRPRRRVALKVMQRGMATPEARRRFEFEAEVLARLRHPAIAQIYEAGTHDDETGTVPWFAMEHIPSARPITDYARTHALGTRDRVALFADVCDAVQHGHQKGVIHRDLKPGNILVDANGQPKVIDFGIARLTDPDRAAITHETSTGQLIGTLNYMSPEQCGSAAADLDVRADVYSLGAVLYELLCGRLPHDLGSLPVVEALRVIQEESPARPVAIDRALRGDLEAIILKAIDKDRGHRYGSAGALARDLRRHLEHEMIEARALTLLYQVQLFARRNRRLIAAAIVVALAIVGGAAASVSFAVRAGSEASRRRAAEVAAIGERDTARWQAYVANVGAAFYAHEAGEFQWMRARLRDAPASLRGWEWQFLHLLAEPSQDRWVAHDDMIFGMDLSADGRRMATASRDGTMRIWDPETHALIATGTGHETWVFDIAYSPDERKVVTGSEDSTARIWDASSGAQLLVFDRHESGVAAVAWSRLGVIASASRDGVVWVWDAATGDVIERFRTVDGGKSGVSFSTDGRRLAAWGAGPTLTVRGAATREVEREFIARAPLTAVAWRDDDRRIVAVAGSVAHVWDVSTGELVHEIGLDSTISRSITFFADGTRLAAGVGRGIFMWDLGANRPETVLFGHEEAVSRIRFSPDEGRIYSASWDGTVRAWDRDATGPVKVLRGHDAHVLSTAFSPDGAIVASASDDGTIRLWEAATGRAVRTLDAHADRVRALSFAPDGTRLASGSYDRTVRVWGFPSCELLATLEGHSMNVSAVAFDASGRRLASGSSDTTIRLWDPATHATVHVIEGHSARVNALAFSPDGRFLASASRDATVRVWDAETGAPVHTLTGHASDVFAVVFSHDGRRLYSGSRDQTVRVWDTASGAAIQVLAGHGQLVTSLALSPDGRRLAAGSWFEKIILWDVATGDQVATLTGHRDAIRSVAFDPSGERLVSGSYDRTVRIWDCEARRPE